MNLERYSRACGPAVVASVLGISRVRAALKLCEIARPTGRRGITTCMRTIGIVLGRATVPTSFSRRRSVFEPLGDGEVPPSGVVWYAGGTDGKRMRRRVVDDRPTLARWLRENPREEAILRLAYHFIHVRRGRVIESNGIVKRRARVTHVIRL